MMKYIIIIFLSIFSLNIAVAQNTIVGYEYWFNNAEKTKSSVTPSEIYTFDKNISTEDLPAGLHQFNIRFIDSNGVWSSIVKRSFYKLPVEVTLVTSTILEFQYWIDNDFENVISIPQSQEIIQIDELLSMSELTNGLHQLNVRFKDSNGYWSSIKTTNFYKPPVESANSEASTIAEFQYWLNNDFENAVSIAQNQEIIQIDELLSMPELKNGLHQLNVRFKDSNGYWSSIKATSFYKMPTQTVVIDPTITNYRYWFDDDTDNIFTITVDEPTEIFNWTEDLPMPEFMWSGERSMFIQFKDNSDYWSSPIEHKFEKNLDPRGNIYAENSNLCSNELAQFYIDAADIDVVYWNFGDGSPVVEHTPQSQVTHKYKEIGEYVVSALLRHEDSDTEIEEEITISVLPSYGIVETAIYSDDFEDTEINSFPDGWVMRYNGTGNSDQKIITDPEDENNKVFSLSGTSSWAANLSRYIDYFPPQVILETRMFTQGYGDIRIGNPTVGTWGSYLGGVQYKNGAFIATNYKGSTGPIYSFDNLEPNNWYTVRLEFDFETLTYKVLLDGVQQIGINGGVEYEEFPILEDVEPLSIELSSNSKMLYDDVKLILPNSHTNPAIEATIEVCEDDLPYQFGTQTLFEEGQYIEMFQTDFGCDSLVILDFKINELSYSTDIITACDSYTWIDGVTYTESNNSAEFILTNFAGCDSIVTLDLTINKSPNVDVVVEDNILTVAESDAIYQWKYCNGEFTNIENANEQTFTAPTNGIYMVQVLKNGCISTSECYEISSVGFSNNLLDNITVYPNPNDGKFVVDLGKVYDEIYYTISNIEGITLLNGQKNSVEFINLNLNLTQGVYILNIKSKQGDRLFKIIIK